MSIDGRLKPAPGEVPNRGTTTALNSGGLTPGIGWYHPGGSPPWKTVFFYPVHPGRYPIERTACKLCAKQGLCQYPPDAHSRLRMAGLKFRAARRGGGSVRGASRAPRRSPRGSPGRGGGGAHGEIRRRPRGWGGARGVRGPHRGTRGLQRARTRGGL